jgi:1-aminocyclopropane-1-carboxylate deaminase/D-cysteine desulfhydrase-like pyridoxal-dependent ACC family enzyme
MEVEILDAEKYNHSTRPVHPLNMEVEILDAEKYNHSTQSIGRIRKSRKSKCSKNQIIPLHPRKF